MRKKAAELIGEARGAGRDLLEHEALRLLQEYGFPLPPFEVLPHGPWPPSGPLTALSYPLVVKALSGQIVHKTEAGAVRLNLQDEAQLREARRAIEASVRQRAPQAVIEGWLVRPHLPEGTEIIAGSIVDPRLGPAIMVGIGGVFAEAYRDAVFRLAPLSPIDAEEMIGEIRGQALLDGVRGRPPVSRGALAQLLLRISRLVEENPDIEECDLNPIICRGESLAVADARVRLKHR